MQNLWPNGALLAGGCILLLIGYFVSGAAAMAAEEAKTAVRTGVLLGLAADACFGVVWYLGTWPWRIAAALPALASISLILDFFRRGI